MKEAFEKIKERLEEESKFAVSLLNGKTDRYVAGVCDTNKKAIQIVSEVEAEYGNGWIPVEKALPEDGQRVLTVSIPNIETHKVNIEYYRKHFRHWRNGVILAWMPLPPPYTPTTD